MKLTLAFLAIYLDCLGVFLGLPPLWTELAMGVLLTGSLKPCLSSIANLWTQSLLPIIHKNVKYLRKRKISVLPLRPMEQEHSYQTSPSLSTVSRKQMALTSFKNCWNELLSNKDCRIIVSNKDKKKILAANSLTLAANLWTFQLVIISRENGNISREIVHKLDAKSWNSSPKIAAKTLNV